MIPHTSSKIVKLIEGKRRMVVAWDGVVGSGGNEMLVTAYKLKAVR